MSEINSIKINNTERNEPYPDELPSEYADRIGMYYAFTVSSTHKKENGQFFTPIPIAKLMASFCDNKGKNIKILDPGCGTAILSCVVIEFLFKQNKNIESIHLIAYETDKNLIYYSSLTLKYLKLWLENRQISLTYSFINDDFILQNSKALNNDNNVEKFDIIISNPPYFKLAKDDEKTIAANDLVSGQPNIYSIFMGIASKLLNDNGELIFITPRSFASGKYFYAFRQFFFNNVQIEKIHLFNSRKDTFNRDSVLQETVIIKAIKEKLDPNKNVFISSSVGIRDIWEPKLKFYKSNELIDLNSKEKILHLPISDKEESIFNLVSSWTCTLKDFNIQISTGPVVSFRSKKFIQNTYESESVDLAPLIWLHNVNKMKLDWPKNFKEKGQYVNIENNSKSILIPNKDYILLRRFSTKDDKSRLIAAPIFSKQIKADFIGVENKVNYIYRKNGILGKSELLGLCALLNSELFNIYFQIFNGNVNVSASELREMRFPSLDEIKEIGKKVINFENYDMDRINSIVNAYFETELILK